MKAINYIGKTYRENKTNEIFSIISSEIESNPTYEGADMEYVTRLIANKNITASGNSMSIARFEGKLRLNQYTEVITSKKLTKSEIFKAAHKLAHTFEGNYKACFALALKQVYASQK